MPNTRSLASTPGWVKYALAFGVVLAGAAIYRVVSWAAVVPLTDEDDAGAAEAGARRAPDLAYLAKLPTQAWQPEKDGRIADGDTFIFGQNITAPPFRTGRAHDLASDRDPDDLTELELALEEGVYSAAFGGSFWLAKEQCKAAYVVQRSEPCSTTAVAVAVPTQDGRLRIVRAGPSDLTVDDRFAEESADPSCEAFSACLARNAWLGHTFDGPKAESHSLVLRHLYKPPTRTKADQRAHVIEELHLLEQELAVAMESSDADEARLEGLRNLIAHYEAVVRALE